MITNFDELLCNAEQILSKRSEDVTNFVSCLI